MCAERYMGPILYWLVLVYAIAGVALPVAEKKDKSYALLRFGYRLKSGVIS